MNKYGRIRIIVILMPLFMIRGTYAFEQKLNQAQSHLKKMQTQITKIKQVIHLKKQTHDVLQSKISEKNQLIQKTHEQKLVLDKKLEKIKLEIERLNQQIFTSKAKISSFEKIIYNHLHLHLQLSQQPYWQVIFSANNPFDFYQKIELYQYLYHSEHQTLESLKEAQAQLQQNQVHLGTQKETLNLLEKQLTAKEQIMLQQKIVDAKKLQQVSQEIVYNTEQIKNLEKDQAQLKLIIQNLLKENQIHANRPFTVMRKRLNFPIDTQSPHIIKSQNGIIFLSPAQTKVHAVATGKVVFADWLNGYGYLVIIDHGLGFMTLYGNNEQLLKQKGEYVHQGDVIASVGKSGAFHQTGLYFEIRQKARVVSALNWFQKRAV